MVDGAIEPLVGMVRIRRDAVELPFQFVAELLPRLVDQRYRYDRRQARLIDSGGPPRALAVTAAAVNDRAGFPVGSGGGTW